ncbi:tyrosine-type recombinase/integrase [Bradyrhizobium sp. P5_C12]
MKKLLTDAFCRAIEPPAEGRLEVADMRCAGLVLRVTKGGASSWGFRFRDPLTRRTLRATLGNYPDIGLAKARSDAEDMRRQVAGGVNPIEAKRAARADAGSREFSVLAERYMVEHAERHKRPRSVDEDRRNLDKHVLPKWRKRDYRKIRRADCIELLEGIVAAGTPTAANRVHSLISKIFSFAVDCDLGEDNPMSRLKKRGAEKTGKRVLDDDELRTFWRGAIEKPISRRTGLALRLALLTAGRATEVAGAALAEFSHLNQAKAAGWTIPAERVKNKRDFFLPLSPLALDVVKEAIAILPAGSSVLFPSPRSKDRSKPISGHALTVAMARLAKTMDGKWIEDPPSPHDLRRTVETRMSALGIKKEDRDACLNHKPRDVGSVHYDMYERHKEKRAAFNRYAREIARVLAETPKNRHG